MQITQNDIIKQVLSINDLEFLSRIKSFIAFENTHSGDVVAEPEQTRDEVMAGIDEAFRIAKMAREGKIKGKPIDDFLNEW